MLWRSTRETIEQERVSVLAIVETLFAISIAVGIYLYTGSLVHVLVSAALAPFLLLRTPVSTKQSLDLAAVGAKGIEKLILYCIDREERDRAPLYEWYLFRLATILLAGVGFFMAPVFYLFVKVVVTLYNLIIHPLTALRVIPENWRRVVLCTDSATMPEILPGLSQYPDDEATLIDLFKLESIWKDARDVTRIWWSLAYIVVFIILYLISVPYRWSLKSTAMIWSPLVWVFRPIHGEQSTAHFAQGIVRLSIYRFARWYSLGIAVLFGAKLYIWVAWLDMAGTLERVYGWPVISSYLVPESIPLWHLSAVVNAVLTWIIYFRAENYLHLAEGGVVVSEQAMDTFLKTTFAARNILSVYTAICTLYITKELAETIAVPNIRILGFPW